jgi:hypothetical protein
MPRMQELLSQCRELCEAFETHYYTLAASPGTERAAQNIQEGAMASGQAVTGLLGAATEGAERAVEVVAFPIEGYDKKNVDEISTRLNDLSVEELQLVRDYEELNKRRQTLLEQMDRKIRSA